MANPLNKDPRLKDIARKKERQGVVFGEKVEHIQKDALTPADLVNQIFYNDPKALMKSFGQHGKKRVRKFKKDKASGIVLTRSFHRSRLGNVVMKETIKKNGKKSKAG